MRLLTITYMIYLIYLHIDIMSNHITHERNGHRHNNHTSTDRHIDTCNFKKNCQKPQSNNGSTPSIVSSVQVPNNSNGNTELSSQSENTSLNLSANPNAADTKYNDTNNKNFKKLKSGFEENNSIAELQQQIISLKTQLEHHSNIPKNCNTSNDSTQLKLSLENKYLIDEKKRLETELLLAKEKMHSLDIRLAENKNFGSSSADIEAFKLTEKLRSSRTENSEAQLKIDSLMADIAKLSKSMEESRQKCRDYLFRIAEQEQNLIDCKCKKTKMIKTNLKNDLKIDSICYECDKKSDQLKDYHTKLEKLTDALKKCDETLQELREKLDAANSQNSSNNEEKKKINDINKLLATKIKDLTDENDLLQTSLKSSNQSLEELTKKYKKLIDGQNSKTNETSSNDLSDAKEEIADLNKKIIELIDQNNKLINSNKINPNDSKSKKIRIATFGKYAWISSCLENIRNLYIPLLIPDNKIIIGIEDDDDDKEDRLCLISGSDSKTFIDNILTICQDNLPPAVLTKIEKNPKTTSAGTFLGNIIILKLNLLLDEKFILEKQTNIWPKPVEEKTLLKNLIYTEKGSDCDNFTVNSIFTLANRIISHETIDLGEITKLNGVIENINNNFEGGYHNNGYLSLSK